MVYASMRLVLIAVLAATAACSPATMGINRMAAALSATAEAYGRDDDPEFVRTGAPATLKMVEMMLDSQPSHQGLLLTACNGFTQYAYAFLQVESEMLAGPMRPSSRAAGTGAGCIAGPGHYCSVSWGRTGTPPP